ncbi:MAG: diphosphate--fructose-6-phosphate 1-phosphotransferase [Spirochaetaceae bacterium]|nr:MAG: diphosphate--fructose-6-phosphate 1-phosphotransferase [Spirochaetaceae bacterium]
MKGNVLVGQSGGPTAVINASLAGVVQAARAAGFTGIYGMQFAIEGFLEERLLDLGALSYQDLVRLKHTPGSALGSCRYKVREEDLPRIYQLLRRFDIRYLFYIGGNDTMDTVHRITEFCKKEGYEIFGVGIPKTVDNDLYATDHTPGYPSAARYVALSVLHAGRLARDMQRVDRFLVHQTVGRDAGWLAAASALAARRREDAPHLIYIPERPLTRDGVLADVDRVVREFGWASIVIGEGTCWEDGTPVSAGFSGGAEAARRDRFDNIEFGAMGGGSAALTLHRLITEATGFRGEFQVPESLPMSAADRVVSLDREEAFACGVEAVVRAARGESGVMVTIIRTQSDRGAYHVSYGTAPLEEVAVRARPMPPEMIAPGFVTEAFLEYARPLVGDIEEYIDLQQLPPVGAAPG